MMYVCKRGSMLLNLRRLRLLQRCTGSQQRSVLRDHSIEDEL
jgi:hypothetical protein